MQELLGTKNSSTILSLDAARFEQKVQNICTFAACMFQKQSRYHALFHALFVLIATFELTACIIFLSIFQPLILALAVGGIFFTGFSYFVLRFYFQEKKPENWEKIRLLFINRIEETIHFPKGSAEYHLSICHALFRLNSHLDRIEHRLYRVSKKFKNLNEILEKFGIWMHWKDTHSLRETILFMAIQEYITLVKTEPTDLEVHASLATAYQTLYRLYMSPDKIHPQKNHIWISPEYQSEKMQQKFLSSAQRAIEEFKIVDSLAPHDPWVQMQLAGIYRDLKMTDQEILQYEKIVKHNPEDIESLFQLGCLYFQSGYNAKGLKIYEQIHKTRTSLAKKLIAHYDSFFLEENLFHSDS